MKKVVSKGYTITVTSGLMYGDNYRTKSMVVETQGLAMAIAKMCKELFKSSNNGKGGIGNLMEDEDREARAIILDYVKRNPDVLLGNDLSKLSDSKIVETVMDYNDKLMGGSEYYYSRVCEKVEITYSAENIFLEEVKF